MSAEFAEDSSTSTLDVNPYAAPEVTDADRVLSGLEHDYELIRRKHLKHEVSVQSIGVLYYLSGVIVGFAAAISAVGLSSEGESSVFLAVSFLYGLVAVICFALGSGLRKLRRGVRLPVGIFAAIGLLGFPIGTLINGYILYLVFSKKGQYVFSDEYRDVIDSTPHIKYRTSLAVRIICAIFFALIVFAVISATFA